MKLERVYGMAELAQMIGWDRGRLVRHLRKLDAEHGGALLRNVGRPGCRPRWTTTLSALRSVSPQWFRDDAAIENRLEDLTTRQDQTDQLLEAASTTISVLRQRVRVLTTRADNLESSLRAVLEASPQVP